MFWTKCSRPSLVCSELYNEQAFYAAFTRDMHSAKYRIIIESPFVTYKRFRQLKPFFERAAYRGVWIVITTRDPVQHDELMRAQAEKCIALLQDMGAKVLFTANHHRKLAIIDDDILWEGSLNILSQADSCEMMRRIVSEETVTATIEFTGLERWYTYEQHE